MAVCFPTRPAAGIVLALSLGLAGCTGTSGNDGGNGGGGNDGGGSTPPSAAASATPAPPLPSGVTAAPIPTKVPNEPTVRQNVVLSSCAASDGGWQATGTATNPGRKSVRYAITVFFTTTAATTLNSAKTDVEVEPGKTERWTAKKSFATPKEMLCVLRGVAAD